MPSVLLSSLFVVAVCLYECRSTTPESGDGPTNNRNSGEMAGSGERDVNLTRTTGDNISHVTETTSIVQPEVATNVSHGGVLVVGSHANDSQTGVATSKSDNLTAMAANASESLTTVAGTTSDSLTTVAGNASDSVSMVATNASKVNTKGATTVLNNVTTSTIAGNSMQSTMPVNITNRMIPSVSSISGNGSENLPTRTSSETETTETSMTPLGSNMTTASVNGTYRNDKADQLTTGLTVGNDTHTAYVTVTKVAYNTPTFPPVTTTTSVTAETTMDESAVVTGDVCRTNQSDPSLQNDVGNMSTAFSASVYVQCHTGYSFTPNDPKDIGRELSCEVVSPFAALQNTSCARVACRQSDSFCNGNTSACHPLIWFQCWEESLLMPNNLSNTEGEILCEAKTNFTRLSSASCNRVHCPFPQTMTNGYYKQKQEMNNETKSKYFEYGDEVEYACKDGFALMGVKVQSCNSSGMWNLPPPECKLAFCPFPDSVESNNSLPTIANGSWTVGKTVAFLCENGYQLNGSEALQCFENFTWSGTVPTCDIVECGEPPNEPALNATLENFGTVYGKRAEYRCAYGERGGGNRTCNSSGMWEGTVESCQLIVCSKPTMPMHASIANPSAENGNYRYDEQVFFQCDKGYNNTGSGNSITCSALTYRWTENPVTCTMPLSIIVEKVVKIRLNDELIVWCNVTGTLPTVSVQFKDSPQNHSLSKRSGHVVFNSSEHISYMFHKMSAKRMDSGYYICKAENNVSSVTNMTHVIIQEMPGPPNITHASVTNDTVILTVSVNFTGNAPLTQYNVAVSEKCDKSGKQTTKTFPPQNCTCEGQSEMCKAAICCLPEPLTITDLKPFTEYCFAVNASNEIGNSSNATISLTTAEDVPPNYMLGLVKGWEDKSKWNKTETTLLFYLLPAKPTNGIITKYEVFTVYFGSKYTQRLPTGRRRRASDSPEELRVWEETLRNDITVPFMYLDHTFKNVNQKQDYLSVTIGKEPRPLREGHYYSVRLRAYTKGNLSTLSNRSVVRRTAIRSPPKQSSGNDDAAVVVVSVFIVLVLLLLIIFVIHRHHKMQPQKPIASPTARPKITQRTDIALTTLSPAAVVKDDGTRNPVPVGIFAEHVEILKVNNSRLFTNEYKTLTALCKVEEHVCSLKAENVVKNRYGNIVAYDWSRVVLDIIDEDQNSDYINANYISGYNADGAYIATQGPLPNTFDDFWRMVWQKNSCMIVMLTNLEEKGRLKCHQYWPHVGTTTKYGKIVVDAVEESGFADYLIRSFNLTMDGEEESRRVRQFHFTVWPDHGVPEQAGPLLTFLRRMHLANPPDAGPIVVHCSAGVGRTGTLIVIDTQLKRAELTGTFDIYNNILAIRKQRNLLVQTEAQYIFIHDALLEVINSKETQISITNFQSAVEAMASPDETGETPFQKHFAKLTAASTCCSTYEEAAKFINQMKNQPGCLLPPDETRVQLSPLPGIEGSDYINANYISGYRSPKAYIATQAPLPHTAEDFWRMVWEQGTCSIVMLARLDEIEESARVCYWPEKVGQGMQYGDLLINLLVEESLDEFVVREMDVCNLKDPDKKTRLVAQYQFVTWSGIGHFPAASAVIDVSSRLAQHQQLWNNPPIVIHCVENYFFRENYIRIGAGRTGTFCAIYEAVDHIKANSSVDIFEIVKTMRMQRPLTVHSLDEYTFIYDCAAEYLRSLDNCSNSNAS